MTQRASQNKGTKSPKRKAPKATDNHKSENITKDLLIEIYKDMLLFRRFEERANSAYTKRKFSGFCHLHIGQEAVCVGVQKNLRPTDYVISGYRSHTQAIAKGISPGEVMAELFGKATGCSKGKGGSMHMFSHEHRFLGGHGIVGGQVPLAIGAGFAIKYREEDDLVVCYLGDGATNQGQFFESLNMAQTWGLPVLFIIENNQYGMGTSFQRVTSVDGLWKRALAFDMDYATVDGMNVLKVFENVQGITQSMRRTSRPFLLEALTYRYRGHSVSDPATYRTKEEVKSYQDQDPIIQQGQYLIKKGFATEEELAHWDDDIRQQVKEYEEFADNSPKPEITQVWTDVYAN